MAWAVVARDKGARTAGIDGVTLEIENPGTVGDCGRHSKSSAVRYNEDS